MANLAKENALKLGMACMDRFYGQKQLLRKINKPLVEKRRRARINSSLQQLKTLVVESLNKTGSPKAKLEKADILEMTVRYIRNMQRQQYAASSDPQVASKYKLGFKACITEVDGYFGSININPDIKSRVLEHLSSSAETSASPKAKTKPEPEATITSEETETPKAPLQTLQIRDEQKPKSVACKKLMMPTQEAPSSSVSCSASSSKSVISELAPVTSVRLAPSAACGKVNTNSIIYTSPNAQMSQKTYQVPNSQVEPSAACGKASSTIYTSPNAQMSQKTYQAPNSHMKQRTYQPEISVNGSGHVKASATSTRVAPYNLPSRQQNQGLGYRVNHANNPNNNVQQIYSNNMYAQIAPQAQGQNIQGNGNMQNIAQQAQPMQERNMWRPW